MLHGANIQMEQIYYILEQKWNLASTKLKTVHM